MHSDLVAILGSLDFVMDAIDNIFGPERFGALAAATGSVASAVSGGPAIANLLLSTVKRSWPR